MKILIPIGTKITVYKLKKEVEIVIHKEVIAEVFKETTTTYKFYLANTIGVVRKNSSIEIIEL